MVMPFHVGVLGTSERNAELGITFRCSQNPNYATSNYLEQVECRIAKKRHERGEIEVVPVLISDPGKDECAWLMALQGVPQGEKSWAEVVLRGFPQYDGALGPIRNGIKAVVERVRKRREQGIWQEPD